MDNNNINNIKILKNEKLKNNVISKNYKEIANKSINEPTDLSNVLNLTGDFDNSMEKGQVEIVKDFVRDARKNVNVKEYKKNAISELIDSDAFSKFNFKTKIKYCYYKHEWTFLALREFLAFLIILISFFLYKSSLKSVNDLNKIVFYFYYPMDKFNLFKCIASGFLIGLILFFIYMKFFFIEHFIYIFIVYFIFIHREHGNTIGHHGLFNAFIFLFITFLIFGLLLSFNLLYTSISGL